MRLCPADGSDRFGEFDGSRAKFKDDVQSFSTVEPAVDLTAASPLAFAWLSVPVSSTPPCAGRPS